MYGMAPKAPPKKKGAKVVTQDDIDREYAEKQGPMDFTVPKGESAVNDIDPQEFLFTVAKKGDGYVVSGLLDEKGVDVNKVDKAGKTALYYAALGGFATVCQILCDKGANVNFADHNGETPLHNACWKLRPSTIMVLVGCGADTNATNGSGRRPIDLIKPPAEDDAKKVWGKVLYDYAALNEGELSFFQGDYLEVVDQSDPDWFECILDNNRGYAPTTYFEVLSISLDQECRALLQGASVGLQYNPEDLKGSKDSGYSSD